MEKQQRSSSNTAGNKEKEKPINDDDEGCLSIAVVAAAAAAAAAAAGEEEEKKKRSYSVSASACASSSAAASVRKGGGGGGVGGGTVQPCCQAEKCTADLTEAKRYHRRHKVCEQHSKAAAVVVAGLRQRFCQQCSRFHELSEFDDSKRSCRRRLAGHNERRRKMSAESQGEDSKGCRQADPGGRTPISLPGNSSFKHFQIR